MTLAEAITQRIPRVRLPHWADPNTYLRLPLFSEGRHGPWAELYDDRTQTQVLIVRPGSQRVCVFFDSDDRYERYDGPISSFEQDAANFASAYEER